MLSKEYFEEMEYTHVRQLPDGTWVGLYIQLYDVALVVGLNDFGYEFKYCYEHMQDAILAILSMKSKDDVPVRLWIKRKGLDGEVMGPGAKGEKYG